MKGKNTFAQRTSDEWLDAEREREVAKGEAELRDCVRVKTRRVEHRARENYYNRMHTKNYVESKGKKNLMVNMRMMHFHQQKK